MRARASFQDAQAALWGAQERRPRPTRHQARRWGGAVTLGKTASGSSCRAEALGQQLLDAGHVHRRHHRVELAHLRLLARDDARDAGRLALRVDLVHQVADGGAEVQLGAALLEVRDDRVVQVRLRRALEHPQHRRLRTDREHHEDRQHAPRRDVVAVDKAQRVGDGVPHPIDTAAAAAERREPLGERNVVEVPDLCA